MGFTISIVIFVFIAWGFLKILGETIINLIKLINAKSPQELKKTRHLLFIKGGFLLPWELINLTFTFVFAFIIFHWFTSSIFIIALTSFLFKEIFSEIPYLLLSSFYYLLKKPISLKEDPFMQKTEIIPVNFFSCLYIPQKAKSISDVYAGITQGLRALRNNLQPKSHLVFIYHSDSEEDRLIEEEIRLILEAKKEFGEKIFIFARNREAYNPFFLRKPGGYISDYQILNTGIWHPLNYVGHNFDARRQKVVSLEGVMRDHIPFYSSGEKKENQYFLLYRRNLFLKEKMNLRRIKEDRELFENIEFSSQGYLINKDKPEEYYLLSQG
ncbi:MAG: hypothetical protein NC920_03590, partial [Candidatus Omnitrophica bacterium]|nr:hypothetical protein [Candidatus Omnitrophota bacterium]